MLFAYKNVHQSSMEEVKRKSIDQRLNFDLFVLRSSLSRIYRLRSSLSRILLLCEKENDENFARLKYAG